MPTLIMPKEAAVRKFHPAVWCAAIALAGLITGSTIRVLGGTGFPLNPIATF